MSGGGGSEPIEYEVYLQERARLVDGLVTQARQFDRTIITLSAGALVVSLGFIEKIVPLGTAQWRLLLVSGWAAFILSVLLTLVSFLASQESYNARIGRLADLLHERPSAVAESVWTRMTPFLNYASAVSFFIGAVAITVFVACNIL